MESKGNYKINESLIGMSDSIWRELSGAKIFLKIGSVLLEKDKEIKNSSFLILSRDCYSSNLISTLSKILKTQRDSCTIFKIADFIHSNIKQLAGPDENLKNYYKEIVKEIRAIKEYSIAKTIVYFRDNMGAHICHKKASKNQYTYLSYSKVEIERLVTDIEAAMLKIYKALSQETNEYYKGDFEKNLLKIINSL